MSLVRTLLSRLSDNDRRWLRAFVRDLLAPPARDMEVVKRLREQTGASLVDILRAWDACDGAPDKMVEWLRRQGQC
jgi:hypothetical protein